MNLACFFAYHVLWPRGLTGAFDWSAALMTLAAAAALFRFRRNAMEVIAASAGLGLLATWIAG